ncbi:uncharacterized protein LOC110987454 [Acanthaster planci]|uniref:Uncharacterized protein LOC110987454 n=1 Tax=Acanthaster planci TaxID=133434 RepID=A0A8B7ZK50_ACAPL|nr:uncharacterized protein LOC110987454 [Acanthaster planci]
MAASNSPGCYVDRKLQNQLSLLQSPEFDVTINDVGEIINILNVIKAKCAPTPEKFRLLVGLLCEVDLSITNIEEHYEQLMIKNRIFHLLRMFPDVAHPLLDIIARATNRCCPLASLPVTIGRIEQERQACSSEGLHSYNHAMMPRQTPLLQHSTCLRMSAPNNQMAAAAVVPGNQQAGILSPQRLSGVTQPTSYPPSVQGMTTTLPAGQPVVGGRSQLVEFDLSRKLYDQIPPSLLQSPLQAGVNSSGARESPSDIQKRILLQQQQHLRQQLEMLQVQRLQQACVRNLSFGQKQMSQVATTTVSSTPLNRMESSMSANSAVIGPSRSVVQPKIMTRSARQLSQQQPIPVTIRNRHSGSDIKALDPRSPEKQMASNKAVGKTVIFSSDGHCVSEASKNTLLQLDSVVEGAAGTGGRESGDEDKKDRGLCLSQVGHHCIMVSVRDGRFARTQDSMTLETDQKEKQTDTQTDSAKSKTKQRQKKGKAGHGCKGAVIDVKNLCHMHDIWPSDKHKKSHFVSNSGKQSLTVHELNVQHQNQPEVQGPNKTNNNSNNKHEGIPKDMSLSQTNGQSSSRKRKSHQQAKSRKKRRRRSFNSGGTTYGMAANEESAPIDLYHTPPSSGGLGNVTAPNAVFEPTTGTWRRKPDGAKANKISPPQRQVIQLSQNPQVKFPADLESTYLLCSSCDDEMWYQSSQSDETDTCLLSNASPVLAPCPSNIGMKSQAGTFLERLMQHDLPTSHAEVAQNSTADAAATTASTAPRYAGETNLSRTRKDKKKKH